VTIHPSRRDRCLRDPNLPLVDLHRQGCLQAPCGIGADHTKSQVRPGNCCARVASLYERCADAMAPSAACQVRTPTGAAAHDRAGRALRFGQPSRWSGPDMIRNRQAALNRHKKGTPGSCGGRILPAGWHIVPAPAGTGAHCAGWKPPLEAGYLEFVCVQVRVRFGEPASCTRSARPGGTVRVWCAPMHQIFR
jgi:hypothetical protein